MTIEKRLLFFVTAIKNFFKQSSHPKISLIVLIIGLFITIITTRIITIIQTHASGTNPSIEAESSTLTGPVTVGSDPNASNGQYLQFNAIPTVTSIPTPTNSPTIAPTFTPTPIPPTPTPSSQVVVSNLIINDTANAANWSIQKNPQIGNIQYGDRAYTFASIPNTLAGASVSWIKTANSSKTYTGTTLATFSINQTATVYIGIDERITTQAFPWMSGWTNTNTTVTNNETNAPTPRTFAVWSKQFSAGTVTLGPDTNGSSYDTYTVFVK